MVYFHTILEIFLLHIKLEILYYQGFNVNFRLHTNEVKSRKAFPSNKGNNSSLKISIFLYLRARIQSRHSIVSPFSNYCCLIFRRTIFTLESGIYFTQK